MNAQTTILIEQLNDATAPMILHAAKNPIPDDKSEIALADIVECDFAGYVPRVLNDFGEITAERADIGEALTDVAAFEAASPLPQAQEIYFLYITRHPQGGPAALAQIFNLITPIDVVQPGQRVEFQVRAMCEGLT